MLAKNARHRRLSNQSGSEKLALSREEAARARLRLEAGHSFLKEFEAKHGPITAKEVAEVRRRWPRD